MYCVFMDHIVLCFALICVCYFPGERIDYEKVWRTISLFLHNNNFSSCQALTVFPLAGRWSHCKTVVAMEKLEDLLREASLDEPKAGEARLFTMGERQPGGCCHPGPEGGQAVPWPCPG